MKNNVTPILYLVVIILVTIGCSKNPTGPQGTGFTVTSASFVGGVVDHKRLKNLKSPQISFKNIPPDAKMIIITIKDDQHHVYWRRYASTTEVLSEQWKRSSTYSPDDFNIPKQNKGATLCIIEAVALNVSEQDGTLRVDPRNKATTMCSIIK